MKLFFIAFLATTALRIANAQANAGSILYFRQYSYINASTKLAFMSKEEIDRQKLTWGKNEGGKGEPYNLYFNAIETQYLKQEEEIVNVGYTWNEGTYIWQNKLADKQINHYLSLADKTYNVSGDAPKYRWKILNEIMEVAGYICMKAETTDPIKGTPVYAWFTDKIPVSSGPEGYGGLPGMILKLEMNTDVVVITAEQVTISPNQEMTQLKKVKSKKADLATYQANYRKLYDNAIQSKRNPFWQLRY